MKFQRYERKNHTVKIFVFVCGVNITRPFSTVIFPAERPTLAPVASGGLVFHTLSFPIQMEIRDTKLPFGRCESDKFSAESTSFIPSEKVFSRSDEIAQTLHPPPTATHWHHSTHATLIHWIFLCEKGMSTCFEAHALKWDSGHVKYTKVVSCVRIDYSQHHRTYYNKTQF